MRELMVPAVILGLVVARAPLVAPVLSLATVAYTVGSIMLQTRSGTVTNGQMGHESGAYIQRARFVGHDACPAHHPTLAIQRQSKQEDT